MSTTDRAAPNNVLKDQVREFWDEASCGEVYAEGASASASAQLHTQARARYQLEPYLPGFARFEQGADLDVLEIGVGMGADHHEWAKHHPRNLVGVDLTPRAVEFTRARHALEGLTSDVRVADAEQLLFDDASFDLVYSWGVLHHSAIAEVHRVLRLGGRARVMIQGGLLHLAKKVWRCRLIQRALPRGLMLLIDAVK